MYEYELVNKITREHILTYGRNWNDMLKRNPSINPDEWRRINCEYVD